MSIFEHSFDYQTSWRLLASVVGILVLLTTAMPVRAKNPSTILLSESARLAGEARKQGTMAVQGFDGWLFFDQEPAHIASGAFWGDRAAEVSRASKPEFADPLPAILDSHAQLQAAGVELLLVPVPPKAMIYPDLVSEITLFRRAQHNPEYWQDKKLVIWVFTAREFTHADGWRLVPIAP